MKTSNGGLDVRSGGVSRVTHLRVRLGKRLVAALAGPVLLLVVSASPVAADTTGGGNQLSSFASSCVGAICTDTTVNAYFDPYGSTACLDISTRLDDKDATFVSDEFGCARASSFTITSGLAATLGATDISLDLCDADTCGHSRTVTVSAGDSPTGPISTTSGRTTTRDGTCTSRIKFTDRTAEVAGTFTVDGTTTAELGNVSTHTETSKTTCRT